MDADAAKANEKQFFEFVNLRDTTSMERWIDNFVAEDFINHNPVFDVPNNRDGLKEMFRIFFNVFPEMKIIIEEMVFENQILCFRHIIQGIKKNEDIAGIAMIKYKNGKITDRWATTEPI